MLLNFFYAIVFVLVVPWILYRQIFGKRPIPSLWARLTGNIPDLPNPEGARIWCHGVSVGEVQLLAGLIEEITRQANARNIQIDCVLSSSTTTGLEVARKRLKPNRVFPFPFDFTWSIRHTLQKVRPDILILGELELWPNLMTMVKAHDIPIIIVNARMSEQSFRGYRLITPIVRTMLQCTAVVLARSSLDAERFIALGASKVMTSGSMKFDGALGDRKNPNVLRLQRLAAIPDDAVVFLAGSTQAPEEELAIHAFKQVSELFPSLYLMIAPRHVERSAEIAKLLESSGMRWQLRSELERNKPSPGVRILLIDSTGELGWWWGTASIAFVGGSLDGKRGGQNMIEPASYGCAVAFGPHTRNFREEVLALLDDDAAEVVQNGLELEAFLRRCMMDNKFRHFRSQQAMRLVSARKGARSFTAARILDSFHEKKEQPAPGTT